MKYIRGFYVFIFCFFYLTGLNAQQDKFKIIGNNSSVDEPTISGRIAVFDGSGIQSFGPLFPPNPVQVFTNDFTATCIPSGFTFARASTAWEWNSTPTLTAYATNVPMCPAYYNAGATNYGLGFWGTRQNRWANSATPATQSQTIPAGTYAMRVTGSGSLALTGGSATCTPSCTATAGNPVVVNNPSSASLTGTVTGTLTYMGIESCSGSIIAVCAPSAPIVSTATFPTRQPDKLDAPFSAVGLDGVKGSAIIEINIPVYTTLNNTLLYLSDGSGSANGLRLILRSSDHKLQLICDSAGIAQSSVTTASAVPAGNMKVGIAWNTSQGYSVAFNGLAAASSTANCPFLLNKLHVGSDALGATQLNGYYKKLTLYNGRLDAAYLQVLTAASNPSLNKNFNLSFDAGQSNNAGRRSYPPLTVDPPYAKLSCFNDRWTCSGPRLIYNYLSFGNPGISGITPAFESCGQSPPYVCSDWGEVGNVAGGAQKIFMGNTSDLVVRGAAAGSTTLAAISPGTNPFTNMTHATNIFNTFVVNEGGTVNVTSGRMVNGESDRSLGTTYADYTSQLTTYVNTFASQIRAITGQGNDPNWYQIQLTSSAGHNGTGSPISLAQYDIALGPSAHSLIRLCIPAYPFEFTPVDGLHFTNTASVWKGEYLGYCEETERVSGIAWKPTYPTIVTFSGNLSTILTTWSRPTGNIKIDDGTHIQQGVAYKAGLQFLDSCILANPTAPYTQIDTVTVASNSTIQITLTAPYNSVGCSNPILSNAYNSPGLASQTAMPVINVAGTSGTPGACVLTVSIDPTNAQVQATYNATISAGGVLTSINSLANWGLYAPQVAGLYNGVNVTGCGLTGAKLNSVRIQNTFSSATMSSAWSTIRDENITLSRTGKTLYNWAPSFNIPIIGP